MRIQIDKDLCVGDHVCVKMCPEIFEMNGDVATVIIINVPEQLIDVCLDTAEMCPECAIVIDI
jgi:ferredoxin